MIENIVRSHLVPSENFIYGFADLTGLLIDKFKGYNYGISIGLRLDRAIVDEIIGGPTMRYFLHYKKINEDLAVLSGKIIADLKNNNIDSLAISPTVSTEELDSTYYNTLRTDLSHKMVATRAGLGWIGKTDLLVTRKFGPKLRLTSILLKESVVSHTRPINKSKCGSCRLCVDICPAQAATGTTWDINIEREIFFDAWKCRNQCAEFGRTRLSANARVCGMCVAACPIGTI
jgi:epoxyqueuosine reductase